MSMIIRRPPTMVEIPDRKEAAPRLLGDAGSPPGADPGKWWHHCQVERDMVPTQKGKACPSCDREEGKPLP